MNKAPCPQCGYPNRDTAVVCNLCKSVLKTGTKKAEKAVRRAVARSSFYAEQAANKRASNILLFAAMSIATGLGALIFASSGLDPLIGAGASFVIAWVLGAMAWFGGSSLLLNLSGARPVTQETHPQLFNVVEEMKIASGLPMPDVRVIDTDAPNAFAMGRDPNRSTIAVTRGLLEKLNRDELQGVIAHEFSHIKNLDIRYMMLVGVVIGTAALMADAFLRGFGRHGRSFNPVLMIAAVAFAIVAPISARLLQMAISRSREFLADASAVELTRNPDGLASALMKISSDPAPLETANRATQHLYIVNPIRKFSMESSSLFSTHPPTEARIAKLEAMGAKLRESSGG